MYIKLNLRFYRETFTNLIFINLGKVVEDWEVLRQVFRLWTHTVLNDGEELLDESCHAGIIANLIWRNIYLVLPVYDWMEIQRSVFVPQLSDHMYTKSLEQLKKKNQNNMANSLQTTTQLKTSCLAKKFARHNKSQQKKVTGQIILVLRLCIKLVPHSFLMSKKICSEKFSWPKVVFH